VTKHATCFISSSVLHCPGARPAPAQAAATASLEQVMSVSELCLRQCHAARGLPQSINSLDKRKGVARTGFQCLANWTLDSPWYYVYLWK